MNCLQHVRKDWSDDEVNSIPVDQSSNFLDSDVGLELVVGNKKLHFPAAHFPAEILERELKAIFRLLAEHGRRAGERIDKADLELFLCANGVGYKKKCCSSHERREYSVHFPLHSEKNAWCISFGAGPAGQTTVAVDTPRKREF